MNNAAYRKMMGLPPPGQPQDVVVIGARQMGKTQAQETAKRGINMPKPAKMSQAEIDYGRLLQSEFPGPEYRHGYEEITLRLRSGTRYSPDWVVYAGNRIVLFVEVKGSHRLGSAGASHEKFKSAVVDYPQFHFRYAKKDGDGWIVTNPYD